MVKVFTYKEYLTEKYRKMTFPLLLDLAYLKQGILLNYYQLVDDIEMADVVIIPVDIKYFFKKGQSKKLYTLIAAAKGKNKIVWVYSAGDIGKTLKLDVYTFRFGGFDSKLDKKTFILPAFIQDPYLEFQGKEFHPLSKEKKPRIGFVGHAHSSSLMLIREFLIYCGVQILNHRKEILDFQSFYPTAKKRMKYLQQLEKSHKIETNFIFRKWYRGGAKTADQRKLTTFEFFSNQAENPYTLCIRGSGNFSTRFYETLAMGRIPLFISTDSRLPLPWLKWENHRLITDEDNFEKDLIQFHETVSEEEFENIQVKNREFWLSHLTREGYFQNIHNYFFRHISK